MASTEKICYLCHDGKQPLLSSGLDKKQFCVPGSTWPSLKTSVDLNLFCILK